jgi:hypothetical protein
VNAPIRLKSNVVLRGAGPTSTVINLGSNAVLTSQRWSNTDSSCLNPPTTYGVASSGFLLSGTPHKGDTQLTLQNPGNVNVGSWISVFSDDDPSLVTGTGEDGFCAWCADNAGSHFLQQIVQVTAKNGTSITISRPLYYTLYTNPQFRVYTFNTQKAGIENVKVVGYQDIGGSPIIDLEGCLFCWVKGVQTYNTGSSSESAHVRLSFSYGCEVRDSYVHYGRSSASGANYGIYIDWVNSDHKIENNIARDNRHSIVFQGGGTGVAVLYNYMDDAYTDDLSYLGSARTSHGAHPYMNLFEGNIISHVTADDYWGSSSHFVFFRNWLWGDETGDTVPQLPTWGWYAVDIMPLQTYYSFVGNVLGKSSGHVNWSNALLRTSSNSDCGNSGPVVYRYGCDSEGKYSGSSTSSTSINHGNYDYKTKGVAYWEGGSDQAMRQSMYYSSKPSWYGGCVWPSFGPDLSGYVNTTPAQLRYQGQSCPSADIPSPPKNIRGHDLRQSRRLVVCWPLEGA